jgi:hypothetical protein
MRNGLLAVFVLLAGAGLGIGCDRDTVAPEVQPSTPVTSGSIEKTLRDTVETPVEVPVAAESGDQPGEEAEVQTEVAEASPESPNVRLRLEVHPKTHRAKVFWGRKMLGVAPLEFQRPRRSGPVELVIQSDGFLDYHTRMFTDRDESLVVRMVHFSEQNTLLGYRQTPDAGVPSAVRSPDAGVAPTSPSLR